MFLTACSQLVRAVHHNVLVPGSVLAIPFNLLKIPLIYLLADQYHYYLNLKLKQILLFEF